MLADERYDSVIVLQMQDGSTREMALKEVPGGTKENPHKTVDFTGELRCERCGGRHDKQCPIFTGGLIRARIYDGYTQRSILLACSCVFGAWRHTVQKFPYADDRADIPPLSQREIEALDAVREPGETYLEASEKLPEEFDPTRLFELGLSRSFCLRHSERMEVEMKASKERIKRKLAAWQASTVQQEQLF